MPGVAKTFTLDDPALVRIANQRDQGSMQVVGTFAPEMTSDEIKQFFKIGV